MIKDIENQNNQYVKNKQYGKIDYSLVNLRKKQAIKLDKESNGFNPFDRSEKVIKKEKNTEA